MIEYIFVYGTLRRNSNHAMAKVLQTHADYIADAIIQGQLYQVISYPALIESENPNDKVCGELYKIHHSSLLLPLLDDYEGCTENYAKPHEYTRKVLPVSLTTGEIINAWVYIYNWDTSCLQRISIYTSEVLKTSEV